MFGGLELDQLLHHETHRVPDQIDSIAGAQCVEKFGQGRLIESIGVFSFGGFLRNTPRITPMAHLTADPRNPTTPRDLYPRTRVGVLSSGRRASLRWCATGLGPGTEVTGGPVVAHAFDSRGLTVAT